MTYLCTKFQQILQNNAIDIQTMHYKRSSATQYHCHKDIIVFPTKDIIDDRIKCHESLPIIIKMTHPLLCWVLYKQNDMYGYYNIQFNDDIGIHRCNLWFSKLKINKYVTEKFETIDEIYNKTDETGLLICLKESHFELEENSLYSLISSDWSVRTQTNELGLPLLSKDLFKDIM